MDDFWNQRYKDLKWAYGKQPNNYIKEKLEVLEPCKILFACEGEGRNAVYAATKGFETYAFDLSQEGKNKALSLAKEYHVNIDYQVSNLEKVNYPKQSFDALALIYGHFPKSKQREYHQLLASFLKPEGVLILEGFAKNHVVNQLSNEKAGGPKDHTMLYDLQELKQDFADFVWSEALEVQTVLQEGEFHQGKSDVIRLFGRKIQK